MKTLLDAKQNLLLQSEKTNYAFTEQVCSLCQSFLQFCDESMAYSDDRQWWVGAKWSVEANFKDYSKQKDAARLPELGFLLHVMVKNYLERCPF